MSKNLTIDEGGESRHFDGVRRLKTKLMGEDAGTCYWVPDDETQAWPTFIMSNGMHTAEDEGVYGFSEASVNVYIPSPNPDWDIWIDDDDIPHIKIDDIPIDDWDIDSIELTIDPDTGTPIVDIEDITSEDDDLVIPQIIIRTDDDGLPISDIDFKTDIHVWTDDEDPTKIHIKEEPNGEEIVLDYDDIDGTVTFKDLIDFRYDDNEDKWIIEASTKIKVDDVDYEAGDEIKSWDKDEIVDFTMKVEQEISVDFPDIDPDFGEDFDIELDLDNMELDMDGLDMDIDLPLLKMPDLDDELPDEIRIMHVPDKTSYKDGEAIDLDGIVVQAYKNGAVWQNKKYINGYIPAHELSYQYGNSIYGDSTETVIEMEEATATPIELVYEYDSYQTVAYCLLTRLKVENAKATFTNDSGNIDVEFGDLEDKEVSFECEYTIKYFSGFYEKNPDMVDYFFTSENPQGLLATNIKFEDSSIVTATRILKKTMSMALRIVNGKQFYANGHNNMFSSMYVVPDPSIPTSSPPFPENIYLLLFGNLKGKEVSISWPRPVDSLALTASFPITIDPA